MERQLDERGFDVTDEPRERTLRRPVIAVGVVATAVIAASAGMVALALSDDKTEGAAHAADSPVITSLGRTVVGGDQAIATALPAARAALDGTIERPTGLKAGSTDPIPARVLQSYRSAEATLATQAPSCKLPWWLLAGVGKVESNHAAGGQVDSAGTTTVRIVGPRLDGSAVGGSVARDTDKGALDGDLTFDRGVGPMLLVPQTWAGVGRDGNGDGVSNVSNADDAALAVGAVLCSAGADLTTPDGLAAGLVELDDSPTFPGEVLPWAAHYRETITKPTATRTTAEASTSATEAAPTPEEAETSATPTTPTETTVPTSGPGFTTQPADAPATTTPPTVAPRPTSVVPARPVVSRPSSPRPAQKPRPTRKAQPTPRPVAPTRTAPARPPAPTRAPAPTKSRPPAPAPTRRPTPSRPSTPVEVPVERPTDEPSATPAPQETSDDRRTQRQRQREQRQQERRERQRERREQRQREKRDQRQRERGPRVTPRPADVPSSTSEPTPSDD